MNKILRIMRLTTVVWIATLMHVSAAGLAQKITLSKTNAQLEIVLNELRRQSGFNFIYTDLQLKKAKAVDIHVKDATLERVLQEVFRTQPLVYAIDSKTVVVKEKEIGIIENVIARFQTIDVRGRVLDKKGLPLPGASIVVAGRQKTVTDQNGNFSLSGVELGMEITISYIGYKPTSIRSGKDFAVVVLEISDSKLDEVQVMAYGTTSKRLATGNITKVSGEVINNSPVSNPMLALEGRVPGLIVSQTSGVPGAAVKFQIRGRTQIDPNFGAGEMPLFVIDGVPMASEGKVLSQLKSAVARFSGGGAEGLSPFGLLSGGDIESIEILKDADATAIYGSRGASGVILITTKKGIPGQSTISARFDQGFSKSRLPDLMNTQQYIAMRKEAFKNDKITMTNTNAYDLLLWDTTRTTNLAEELIGGTASNTNAQVGISGGANNVQYSVRGNYMRETNVYPKPLPNTRINVSMNLTGKALNNKMSYSLSGGYGDNINKTVQSDLASFLNLPPHFQLYNDDGSLAWNQGGLKVYGTDNPLASLQRQYTVKSNSLNGSALLGYSPIPDLTIKAMIGYNKMTSSEVANVPRTSINPLDVALSSSSFGNSNYASFNFEPHAEYRKTLGKGKLTLLAGSNMQSQNEERKVFYISSYTSDALLGTLNGIGANGITSPSSAVSSYKYNAVFGRATYNYDDTYILNISGSRDGSSRFGPNYKYSVFGAVGTSWIFSNLAILKDSKVLSFGKLRASYGTTGNDKIKDYLYQPTYAGIPAGMTYRDSLALLPQSFFKPDLHWEMNKKLEIATSLGFLKDRIYLELNWYRGNTSDPLVAYPLPASTGFLNVTGNLKGVVVQNAGWEILLNTTNIKSKSFSWNTSFNITVPRNRLIKYPGLEESTYANSYFIGKSLDIFFGASFLGVDPATGLYQVEDLNKSGAFDLLNRQDYMPQFELEPDFYGGLSNTFTFKNVSLSTFFNFNKGYTKSLLSILNYSSPIGNAYNVPTYALNRWQYEGQQTDIQKFTTISQPVTSLYGAFPTSISTAMYTNTFYVRLQTLNLSYSIPQKFVKDLGLKTAGVYLQSQNLFSFAPFGGFNPDTFYYKSISPLRTIVMGIQVSL